LAQLKIQCMKLVFAPRFMLEKQTQCEKGSF